MNGLGLQSLGTQNIPGEMGELMSKEWTHDIG